MRKIRIIGGSIVTVAALLVLIGSLLPWERTRGINTGISKNGIEGPWVLTLAAGITIIVMGILTIFLKQNPFPPIVAVLGGLGCAAVAVLNLVYLTGRLSKLSTEYAGRNAGEGLYMVLVGSIIVVVGSVAGIIGSLNEDKNPTSAAAPFCSCPSCGNPVVNGAKFCIRCGKSLPEGC